MSNDCMKLFARVLLKRPAPSHPDAAKLKDLISSLPPYLRASGFHRSPSSSTGLVQPGYLCDLHKGLKKGLCYELMAMVRGEIARIGQCIYPVIMSGQMDPEWELRARSLEPVPGMYTPGFTVHDCTPVDREPVYPGYTNGEGVFVPEWGWETSQCPACMLARIGADKVTLFVLLAGMVARISRHRRGPMDNLKSRRVRFVKEWLEAHENSQHLAEDAFNLGNNMRDIRRAQRSAAHKAKKRARKENGTRVDTSEHGRPCAPVPRKGAESRYESRNSVRESTIGVDISDPYAIPHQQASTPPTLHPKAPAKKDSGALDTSERFVGQPAFQRNRLSSGERSFLPRSNVAGSDRNSDGAIAVGVDISEPFFPGVVPSTFPRPSILRRTDSEQTITPKVKVPSRSTSVTFALPDSYAEPSRDKAKRSSSKYSKRSASISSRHQSIASSFVSDVSLMELWPPSDDEDLVPAPLRQHSVERITPTPKVSSRQPSFLATISESAVHALPRPHPKSIYSACGSSEENLIQQHVDVSPPATPTGLGGRDLRDHGHFDVSPPSSPEQQGFDFEFDISPPGSPSRPVTTWGALYK